MTTQPETIADQVDTLQGSLNGQVPGEILDTFLGEQVELDAAGVPSAVAAVGTAMPDGNLLDVRGGATTLAKVRAGKAAVVVFYRGAWCPYCNLTLRTYQNHLVSELEARGAILVAISPQKPDGSLSMHESNELTFTVVSDPGNQIATQLGILTAPNEDVKQAQGALGLDLAATNADGTHGLPMPTTAIVDASGMLRWIDVHPNYTTRSEVADILAAYDSALYLRA